MSDLIEAGPRRCPHCCKTVTVLYDHAARWAFCPECRYTIPPKTQMLTAENRAKLTAFKIYRHDRDGFAPRPRRTGTEMLEHDLP